MPAEHKLAVREGDRVREVLLVGTVTVGRSPTCEISSADPRLSRTHAAFDVVAGAVVVRDLDSANGTTVNGARITEHQLTAGDRVEVGPFVVELVETPGAVAERPAPSASSDHEATVMRPIRTAPGPADAAPALTASAAATGHSDDEATVRRPLRPRAPVPPQSEAAPAVPPAASTVPARPEAERRVEPPTPPTAIVAPPPPELPAAATVDPKRRHAARELTFANAALLCIVPLVLISFIAGFVPVLMQPDERTPLLRAYYVALATGAVDLMKGAREPAVPIDTVTSALRRQAGVTSARVISAEGRVMAPLDQAGISVPRPATDAALGITDNPDGGVEVQVPATTGDGRAVVVSLTVDPERVHPAPRGSPLATVLLIASLGSAWLVARRMTTITDSRLSRLGEEVELMTTKQISEARDPFSLVGGRRILDAVTFALSSAGRIAGGARGRQPAGEAAIAGAARTAAIEADSAFRIVTADQGCESLLGMNIHTAPGAHLIDALPDQAVSDEVMRLVTVATPAQAASGQVVTGDPAVSLAIDVVRAAGAAPLSIRFRRL